MDFLFEHVFIVLLSRTTEVFKNIDDNYLHRIRNLHLSFEQWWNSFELFSIHKDTVKRKIVNEIKNWRRSCPCCNLPLVVLQEFLLCDEVYPTLLSCQHCTKDYWEIYNSKDLADLKAKCKV